MEQWIIEVVTAFGYVGIFFLMLAENVFPPVPSEVMARARTGRSTSPGPMS